jgi:hypothetical protein
MECIPSQLPVANMSWMEPSTGSVPQSTRLSQTQVAFTEEDRNVELNLVTKEGDTVTLSLAGRYQGLSIGYREAGQDETGAYANQFWLASGEYEQNFSMRIEGDLSAEELKEIGQVLKTIDKMVKHFVNDRLRPLMQKARQLGKSETIAGLELSMSYSRRVLVAEQSERQATYDPQGRLAETPQVIGGEISESADPLAQATAEADALSAAMARQMEQVRAFADRMTGAVTRIFDHHRRQVADWKKEGEPAMALINRMHKALLAQMSDSATPHPPKHLPELKL